MTSGLRWSFSAANEFAFDHYGISGDAHVSPYRFPGNFVTDRFTLYAEREDYRGRTLSFGIELTASNSPYLANDGFVAQLLKFELEDGSMAVPYRIGAGDAGGIRRSGVGIASLRVALRVRAGGRGDRFTGRRIRGRPPAHPRSCSTTRTSTRSLRPTRVRPSFRPMPRWSAW